MSWWLTSGTHTSYDEDRTGGMSEQAFGHAAEMQPFTPGQVASPDHQYFSTLGLDVCDDGLDDVVHPDLRLHPKAVFDEVVPHAVDKSGCPVHDRFGQLGQLRLG